MNNLYTITLTDDQNRIKNQCISWYKNKTERKQEPVFPILGIAGCLDENTLIVTDKGTLPLKDIILTSRENLNFKGWEKYNGNLKVYNGEKFTNIENLYATDVMNGYEISLESGLSIKVSEIHPLLCLEENKYIWKKAKDLTVNEYISTIGNKNIYKEEVSLIEDYYYMGYYQADGYRRDGTDSFQFSSNEKKRLEEFVVYLQKKHGIKRYELTKRKNNNWYLLKFDSKTFRELVEPVGLDVKRKILPIELLTDKNKKYSYLKGLFNDIGISKSKITFYSLHRINTERVMILCREFGIIFTDLKEKFNQYGSVWQMSLLNDSIDNMYYLFKDLRGSKSNITLKEAYLYRKSKKRNTNKNLIPNISLLFEDLPCTKDFIKNVCYKYNYKNGRHLPSYDILNRINDNYYKNKNTFLNEILNNKFYYDKIINIKPIRQKFYDIEVPEKHQFISNGIISHNSGKSTIISYIVSELNLKEEEVAYCAYTGMASLVLIKKGLNACTIHRLIYIPVEIYDKVEKRKKTIFRKKTKEELNGIKLIVVDEGSMVNDDMMEDLLSFNIPIIMLGDFFQLQPVGGKINRFMLMKQYGVLDKPLRQALDNPIIWIADRLRHGIVPKIGSYGDGLVNVYSKHDFPEEILHDTDQIIAGKNKTCNKLNKFIRIRFQNTKSMYPVEGDKLICVRNDWDQMITERVDTYLVNGLIGTCSGIEYDNVKEIFKLNFKPSFMDKTLFMNLIGDKLVFDDPDCKDENFVKDYYKDIAFNRFEIYSKGLTIDKFMFGNVITVYKMQGSQERHITYYDEVLRKDIYYNHFYTAVTRAEEKLDIIL